MARRGVFYLLLAAMGCAAFGQNSGESVFPLRPADGHAIYLSAKGDGVADDSDALQAAIDEAQETVHHGIVFVPEGRYRLTRSIHVWAGIRLIGYGAKRPVLVLGPKTPGFEAGRGGGADSGGDADSDGSHSMLWFTDERPREGEAIGDGSEFTFFSAVENIDFEIGDGDPGAVAVRFNVAQHSFVAHANFRLGSGRAALEAIGNQAYDIHVEGGQYGIVTGKTSPAWQFLLMDSSFAGQKVAAIGTHEAGMTLVRDSFVRVPVAVEIPEGEVEQLYGRDLSMRDVGTALKLGDAENLRNEITLENVACARVGQLVEGAGAGAEGEGSAVPNPAGNFLEERFTMGLDVGRDGRDDGIAVHERHRMLAGEAPAVRSDVPALPAMATWVNVKTLGVKGDGGTDDTAAIQKAIDGGGAGKTRALYFPSGFYRLTGSLRLRANTALIGLSPFTTQLVLADGERAFQGEGAAIPLVVAPKGGADMVTGIGIATGNANPRAAGVVWSAGPRSLLEDVDFWEGRSEYVQALEPAAAKPLPFAERPKMQASAQEPSLWVKDGGGGIFRGIWSHATTARAGLVIENTTTPGVIYQFSCEHHMKNEVVIDHAAHWRILDLQTEEEVPAGQEAVPVTLEGAQDVTFADTYMYRVSRTVLPKLYAVEGKDSAARFENVKVFSQTRLAFDNSVFDEGSGVEVRARHFVDFVLGPEVKKGGPVELPAVFADGAALERVATGFSNADGLTADEDGTIYFSDAVKNTVYRLDAAEKKAEAIAEVPQSPMAVGVVAPGVLVTLNRDGSVGEIAKTEAGGWEGTALENKPGPLPEGTKLLLPVGLHAELEKLTLLLEHKGYQYRVGSNTAKRSGLEDVPESYFYAGSEEAGSTAMPAMPIPMFRNLHESAQLAVFAPGETRLIASENDAQTWQGTLGDGDRLAVKLFVERGGTSVVEDSMGNVYIASGQVYVYDRGGTLIGVLEVAERPGSLCFGGEDGKTLFVGARSSVYAIRTRAAGR
ncbi:MAG TPA: glycosyl hydrolase family 28-related protein [Acidobacteriaceae bacterium]|jgi:sugar lactone lactonase YvrE|nr:glycosyl hydrolase family 28-related protein [Acidobacteriaceae bacterium]